MFHQGAAHTAETEELKTRTLETTRSTALAYSALLTALLGNARAQLPELSRKVALAVADMLAVADLLKGEIFLYNRIKEVSNRGASAQVCD